MKNIYKRNFLKDVIFRLDFVNELDIDDFIEKNLSDLRRIYPMYSPIQIKQNNLKINLDNDKTGTVERQQLSQIKQQFFNKNSTARMEISSKSLIINYKKYTNFDQLFSDIKAVISIIKNNSNIIVGRTGLRYVNIFANNDLEKIEWSKYIKSTLLSNETWNNANILQNMSVVNLKKDESLIKIQYGLFNGEIPNDRVKDSFILDIDVCSFELVELDVVETQVKKWNDYIREIFENSITEEMKNLLNDTGRKL